MRCVGRKDKKKEKKKDNKKGSSGGEEEDEDEEGGDDEKKGPVRLSHFLGDASGEESDGGSSDDGFCADDPETYFRQRGVVKTGGEEGALLWNPRVEDEVRRAAEAINGLLSSQAATEGGKKRARWGPKQEAEEEGRGVSVVDATGGGGVVTLPLLLHGGFPMVGAGVGTLGAGAAMGGIGGAMGGAMGGAVGGFDGPMGMLPVGVGSLGMVSGGMGTLGGPMGTFSGGVGTLGGGVGVLSCGVGTLGGGGGVERPAGKRQRWGAVKEEGEVVAPPIPAAAMGGLVPTPLVAVRVVVGNGPSVTSSSDATNVTPASSAAAGHEGGEKPKRRKRWGDAVGEGGGIQAT